MVQVEGRMTLCVKRFARKAVSRMTEAPSVTPSRNRMMLAGRLCYRPVKAGLDRTAIRCCANKRSDSSNRCPDCSPA